MREDGAAFVQADLTKAAELTKAIEAAQPDLVLNLAPQIANTLLDDGHNWKGYDRTLPATTTEVKLLVHASYAFLYGNA